MTKKDKILITTAIDYANSPIHIGHAYQKILADVLARYNRILGKEVYFTTGTDEHGQNIEETARKKNLEPKEYVDQIAKKDKEELDLLNISYNRFIRTTDADHEKYVKEFWKKTKNKGDLYKEKSEGYYCLGCEAFKRKSELVNGRCGDHPSKDLQKIEEENYFFKWSKYQSFLLNLLEKKEDFVVPKNKKREMINFLKQGLKDISVSRKNIDWGISVPEDQEQTIYVWFDALINYYSAAQPKGFWDEQTHIIHLLGKDNLRWHALLWPAMLKAADLRVPDVILAHEFLSMKSKKLSKSENNIITVSEIVKKFGRGVARYYLLRHGPLFKDADISWDRVENVYNKELADGLGNLVQRVSKVCSRSDYKADFNLPEKFSPYIENNLNNFNFNQALKEIWNKISKENKYLEKKEFWHKQNKELTEILGHAVKTVRQIAYDLKPFLPEIAEEIEKRFNSKKIKFGKPLFPKK